MKTKLTSSSYSLIVVMALAVACIILSIGLPFLSKLLPLIFSGVIFVLAAINFVYELTRGGTEIVATKAETEETGETKLGFGAYLRYLAYLVGYLLGIYVIGVLAASFLLLFIYMKTHGTRWLPSIIMTVVTTVILYLLFQLGLDIRLYPGIIFKLFAG